MSLAVPREVVGDPGEVAVDVRGEDRPGEVRRHAAGQPGDHGLEVAGDDRELALLRGPTMLNCLRYGSLMGSEF